ncbi:MAG: Ig-like domain-containing protein, partial [Firmicutes bacterium]|nr:Ig-like domain-containing protein [Bacillota bacterium]
MKKNHINLITVIILLITIALACKKDKLVSDVALTPSTFMLTIDETAILTATVYPHDAANKTINWASSNNDVATIDNGKITAIAVGTVIITVTTEDGNHKAICTVEVISPLHPAEPEMIFVEGGTFTMGCTDDEC